VRGDAVHSFDWTVVQVLASLDRLKLAERTLVVLTSDNGGTLDANGPDLEHGGTPETNKRPSAQRPVRAGKGSPYEGGTRVPFLVRWPGHAPIGVSGELICHVDLLATFAALDRPSAAFRRRARQLQRAARAAPGEARHAVP